MLNGDFRVLGYGLGHSRMIMHAGPVDARPDAVSVEFVGVTAVKLRQSYPGLTLQEADEPTRNRLLNFAGIKSHRRYDVRPTLVCLTLPTEDDGFVVCRRATVFMGQQLSGRPGWRWPDDMTVLHSFRGNPARRL